MTARFISMCSRAMAKINWFPELTFATVGKAGIMKTFWQRCPARFHLTQSHGFGGGDHPNFNEQLLGIFGKNSGFTATATMTMARQARQGVPRAWTWVRLPRRQDPHGDGHDQARPLPNTARATSAMKRHGHG